MVENKKKIKIKESQVEDVRNQRLITNFINKWGKAEKMIIKRTVIRKE